MLSILASKAYELRNPIDIPCAVAFLVAWGMAKPEIYGHRIVALGVVIVDAIFMYQHGMAPIGVLLVPLALIWFAELFGSMRGCIGNGGLITTETPKWMVTGFGWIALLIFSGLIIHEGLGSHA